MTRNALEAKLTGRIVFFDVKIGASALSKCHSTLGDLDPWTSRSDDGDHEIRPVTLVSRAFPVIWPWIWPLNQSSRSWIWPLRSKVKVTEKTATLARCAGADLHAKKRNLAGNFGLQRVPRRPIMILTLKVKGQGHRKYYDTCIVPRGWV